MKLTDIHCHMLPHVDDGPGKVEEATKLLEESYKQGIRRIIVTPHYRPEMFEPSMKRVCYSYNHLRGIAADIGIELRLGCEYYRNEKIVRHMTNHNRPTMAGSKYVLVEFSPGDLFQVLRNYVYDLVTNGFRPIVAHIERYLCCAEIEKVRELKDMGASIQVNASAILGDDGRMTKRYCAQLMKADLIDFIASDSHDIKTRKPNLGKCASYVSRKMGKPYAKRIFVTNPENIIKKR